MADYAARRTMMVDTQVRPSDVTKFPIIEAMLRIPRETFVPGGKREVAYVGEHIDLGHGRAMLDPRTLAKMLESLNVQPSDLVLDIACGLGYSSALIAALAEAVVAVESISELAAEAQINLSDTGADNVALIEGDLATAGAKHGPYDAIIVQGGVEQIPETLIGMLKEGGRIAAIFVDGDLGICRIGHKLDGDMVWRFAFNATAPMLNGFEKTREFAL